MGNICGKTAFIILFAISLTLNIVTSGFSETDSADGKLSAITRDIPKFWWDGGWDKLKDLQDFISNNPNSPVLCARAQYYIGCYYYSKHDYQKAIDEYAKISILYPSVRNECLQSQYEIAQITLNCLNKPEKAIEEYRKVIALYPNDPASPASQLMIGRAYLRMKDVKKAKPEFQKVIDNYPSAKIQCSEACVEIGDLYFQDSLYKDAISFYKKAYLACPASDSAAMTRIMDKIYESLRNLDGSVARADQFIEYQKYGPAGQDKALSTADDLKNPLTEF